MRIELYQAFEAGSKCLLPPSIRVGGVGWGIGKRSCVTATSVGEDLKVYPRIGIPHLLFERFDTSRAFLHLEEGESEAPLKRFFES